MMPLSPAELVTLTVVNGEERREVRVENGRNLRQVLLEHDLTPYAWLTRQLNCGGRGLCATCGVWIEEEPDPTHWHDKLAQQYGYPRLSCQITVTPNMIVHLLPEKAVWGARSRGKRPFAQKPNAD